MALDFIESGKGKVLAAAVPRTLSEELNTTKQVRIGTVQALAVLHALKWFNVISQKDFVFIHMNREAVVVMGFKDENVHYLRQFIHSPHSTALNDAIEEILKDKEFAPRSFLLVGDGPEAAAAKENLETTFAIPIETPSVKKVLKNDEAPEWLWAGIGTGLLSIKPKGELNITGEKDRHSFLSNAVSLYLSAGLAAVSLLVFSLFYLDSYFKQRTYDYLAAEPGRIYRAAFPKSPPARDIVKMFQDKIKLLEKEPGSTAVASGNPLAVLNEMSSNIPADVDMKLQEFVADDKEFTITGTTISFAALEKIKAGVEQMKGISQVEVQNLELGANKQVKFKIKGKL
jgi:hypothetical protein